jgi:hypothetical protein
MPLRPPGQPAPLPKGLTMAKKLTYSKAKRALTALAAVYECADLTPEERADVEMACNTVRAICDRIPDEPAGR